MALPKKHCYYELIVSFNPTGADLSQKLFPNMRRGAKESKRGKNRSEVQKSFRRKARALQEDKGIGMLVAPDLAEACESRTHQTQRS